MKFGPWIWVLQSFLYSFHWPKIYINHMNYTHSIWHSDAFPFENIGPIQKLCNPNLICKQGFNFRGRQNCRCLNFTKISMSMNISDITFYWYFFYDTMKTSINTWCQCRIHKHVKMLIVVSTYQRKFNILFATIYIIWLILIFLFKLMF